MSDREDIAQDAYYDKVHQKREREFKIKLQMTATVYIMADKDIEPDMLEELAFEELSMWDIDDDENCKMIEYEMI